MRKPPIFPVITRRKFLAHTGAAAAGAVLAGCGGGEGGERPPGRDLRVHHARLFPAIGVAPIGNSATGFFVGPEVVEPLPTRADDMRDATGALKRQAARFRVYGYNAAGELLGELNASSGAEVEWTVHLANKKAQWYR